MTKSSASVCFCKVQTSSSMPRLTGLRVSVASTFFSRLIGLLDRSGLGDDEGLLLRPCGDIHTLGMRFRIDVIFLDNVGRVIGIADDVMPNRVRVSPKGTRSVLEVANGNRKRTGINLDDKLIFD